MHASSLRLTVIIATGLFAVITNAAEPAHFHHVRLNVTDVSKSMAYYEKVFGAVPIRFRGGEPGLFTERSFILFNEVSEPPVHTLDTGIWHIGWGGVDVKSEFAWWQKQGVDIHTPLTPLPGEDNFYFYLSGPDGELIEINTMGHHRFAHVHLFADDVNETTDWYAKHLGLKPQRPFVPDPMGDMTTFPSIWMNMIRCDNVTLIVFEKPDIDPPPFWWPDPPLRELHPTDDRPIAHLAFSYVDLDSACERMQSEGVKIIRPIKDDERLQLRSCFVEGPNKVAIEVVEAKPIPEGVWE